MRGCLLEDLMYIPFKTDCCHFIVSFREKTQGLWVLLDRVTIHDHPRPGINSQPAPTTSHIFATTTHDHPRPSIIKSPPPTNNNSLATTVLTIKNSGLYFCHQY